MTTPTGTIGLSDVNTELGKSSTAQISLNDSDVRSLAGIPSGTISMNDLRGKSATLGYVEDVFSTYLYTGTGSTQTINNGIDLAGEGGLVWIKRRGGAIGSTHVLFDTARGPDKALNTEYTNAQSSGWYPSYFTGFTSTGFGVASSAGEINSTSDPYASWTFRKAQKFFDVVTYTGNGASNRAISHNLGSTPGCIIIKKTNSSNHWHVWHRSVTSPDANWWQNYLLLNTTNSSNSFTTGLTQAPTSTTFTVSDGSGNTNGSGDTYVAYLFAHDAGGYGASGSDNIISCGSYVADNSTYVNLGWEPQFIMYKRADSNSDWYMVDNMRGFSGTPGSTSRYLAANTSDPDQNIFTDMKATGFFKGGVTGATYIYIVIRRGPMKTPEAGTEVFSPVARAGTSATATVDAGFPVDVTIIQNRTIDSFATVFDRLRGATNRLFTALTAAEASETTSLTSFAVQTGFTLGTDLSFGAVNTSGRNYINWNFRRAPGFFDVVCYTGTGSVMTINHNLGVVPELMILKNRSLSGYNFFVWDTTANLAQPYPLLSLSNPAGRPAFSSSNLNSTVPTSTVFTVSGDSSASASQYVVYLFATAPGVSKVGSYTGNGSSQTINMGFSTGARFFLVKRTDSTGDWWVYDSARGIVSAADPALRLNSTAAEVTSADAVDTASSGIIVNQEGTCNININGATYIYLGIA